MKKWKVLARHKWVEGAKITETVDATRDTKEVSVRRFTATIRGRRGFHLYEGDARNVDLDSLISKVKELRWMIDYRNSLDQKSGGAAS